MNIPDWFQDPRIKDISPAKLTFLLKDETLRKAQQMMKSQR